MPLARSSEFMITPSQNYSLEVSGSSIKLSVPFRKYWINIFGLGFSFFILMTVFFLPFLNIFIPEELNSTPILPFPFVVLFIPFAALMLIELLWMLFGTEVFEVSHNQIIIRHIILGIGLSKHLLADKVDGVFVSRQKDDDLIYLLESKNFRFWNFTKGKIAINYGKTFFGGINTIRFGTNLDEREAKQIVNSIHEKYPKYRYTSQKKTG